MAATTTTPLPVHQDASIEPAPWIVAVHWTAMVAAVAVILVTAIAVGSFVLGPALS